MQYSISVSMRTIVIIASLMLCIMASGCVGGDDYDTGYKDGYKKGKYDGEKGNEYRPLPNRQKSDEYQDGYRDGYSDGYYGRESKK